VNLLSLAANQFLRPRRVGALYIRKGTPIWPLIDGGLQENKRRAGAENLIGIVGMGMAAEMATLEMPERLPRIQGLKNRLAKALIERIPEIKINGHPKQCLPNLFSVSVEYIEGESLVMMLDEEASSWPPGLPAPRGRSGLPCAHRHRVRPRPGPGHPGLHPGYGQHRG